LLVTRPDRSLKSQIRPGSVAAIGSALKISCDA
jgi:hypothetical protein